MVLERLARVSVHTEALALAVIVVVIDAAEPLARALDAEMVSCVERQFTLPCGRLQQRLRHGDGGGHAVVRLLLHSGLTPLLDIIQIRLILLLRVHGHAQTNSDKKDNNFLHITQFCAAKLLLFLHLCK